MKVLVDDTERGFRYRLIPAADDPRGFASQFDPGKRVSVVGSEYEVRLPAAFTQIHPDLHAVAIWLALRPLVRSVLELPFGVSAPFAAGMERRLGVCFPVVDRSLEPRGRPSAPRPGLLFSGGVDSLAAALVMPADAVLLFMDRIPHFPPGHPRRNRDVLIDLGHTRALCARLVAQGHRVLGTRDDHEHLWVPYPEFHSSDHHLPALYLADSLGLEPMATGDVLCAMTFGGYRGDVAAVRFERSPIVSGEPPPPDGGDGATVPFVELADVGLKWALPVVGLTEVGTALVVNRSPFKGMATSCYNPAPTNYCYRCDKCFKKILLDYVLDDREVPVALLDRFLAFPHLSRIFRRPFFDWHHVWYYIFQKMKCRHPLAIALQRQTETGPDLALFEKWYPAARGAMPEVFRDEVVSNILRSVEPMSPEEQVRLEGLEIPPLIAPEHLLPSAPA